MSIPLPPPPPPEPTGPPGIFQLPPEFLQPPEADSAPPPPPPSRPAPDLGQVQERIERAVQLWGPRDQRMDEDYQLYKLAVAVSGVEQGLEGEIVVKNLPYVTVVKVASLLSAEFPQLSVPAPSESRKQLAERVEDLLRWLWDEWDRSWRRSLHGRLLYDAVHYLALRGWACARLLYDPQSDPPVRLELVDPRSVYPVAGSKGLRYVAVRRQQLAGEVLDEWGEQAVQVLGERQDDEPVTVEAYYDDLYHAVLVDGKFVKEPTLHGFGFVPWAIAIAGGSPVRITEQDPQQWVAEVGVSIFHGVKQAYRQLNKLLSQLATEVARLANPATLYYVDPDEHEEPEPIDLSPGAVNYLIAPKERVEVIRTSPNPSDLSPLVQALQEDLIRGTLPPVLWGQAGPETSGFTVAMLSAAARDALQPVIAGLELLIEEASSLALRLIRDVHGQPLGPLIRDRTGRWLRGEAVGPAEIAEVGDRVQARFREVSPRDRAAMAQIAALLTDKKLVSLRTAREEYLGIDNPDRENERVLEELIYGDSEILKEYLVPLSLARFSPDLFQIWLADRARKQAQAQMAPPAPPPSPPGPPHPGIPPAPGIPPQPAPPQFGPAVFVPSEQAAGPAGMGPEGVSGLNVPPPPPVIE